MNHFNILIEFYFGQSMRVLYFHQTIMKKLNKNRSISCLVISIIRN